MKVAFQSNQLSIRGTEVALYDYAHFNEMLLGNESIILTKVKHHFPHDLEALIKFNNRFDGKIFYYNNWNDAEKILKDNKIDVLYTIKAGIKDEVISKNIKTCVHSVFQFYEPHGDVYAYVSEWLSKTMTNGKYPFVPHMTHLPEIKDDMREELNIPKDAIVFGRHGAKETFNVPFVFDVVNRIVNERKDIYFLFLNTNKICENFGHIKLKENKQIIHLPATSDLVLKTKFINTCDAMLHARINGESFGLTIAEFSIKNKPIITWTGKNVEQYFRHPYDKAYIDILGDIGIYYNDYNELYNIISNFKINKSKNWDVYSNLYNPEIVMKKFKNVFLD